MSGERKPAPRPRAPLIAAARQSAQAGSSQPASASTSSAPPTRRTIHLSSSQPPLAAQVQAQGGSRTASEHGGSNSAGSTPTLPDTARFPSPAGFGLGGDGGGAPPPKMKFKPKVPVRKVKQEGDVKPDLAPVASAAVRGGGPRGRGRGAGAARGGRGGLMHTNSVAAGVFGGARPANNGVNRRLAVAPSYRDMTSTSIEVYSDHSSDEGSGVVSSRRDRVIDIDEVSGLGESAPTSLIRQRDIHGKANKGKAKAEGKAEGKARRAIRTRTTDAPRGLEGVVKSEPISPDKMILELPDPNAGSLPPIGLEREDDQLMSEDEDEDRDERGRRLRTTASGITGEDEEEINEAQRVDLSESESESEEEGMEGDFVPAAGYDDPSDKLFIFQFPHLFPHFLPSGPVDMTTTAGGEDVKPDTAAKDVKPTMSQLRGRKKGSQPPPEGMIGRLVVMKSGKVKMVLGDGIVMDVSPGVSATFLQQLVHLDPSVKAATVLGEVHKQYVVTPDVDRLLEELYLSGGVTPGEKEAARRREMARVKVERGLVKMELD